MVTLMSIYLLEHILYKNMLYKISSSIMRFLIYNSLIRAKSLFQSGKVHFSYIYGIGVLGCLSMWALLSLMSTEGVTIGTVVTVLGYCLLPMVGLSGVNVILSLQ